jgi:hypothetical protein
MPEQAETVDDLITEWAREASLGEGLLEAPVFWELVEKHAPHLHLIPGADAVVTEEGLEAATRTAYEKHHGPETTLAPPITWDELSERGQEAWRNSTRAALEAAGIRVANEVYESPRSLVLRDDSGVCETRRFIDGETVVVIKRREE